MKNLFLFLSVVLFAGYTCATPIKRLGVLVPRLTTQLSVSAPKRALSTDSDSSKRVLPCEICKKSCFCSIVLRAGKLSDKGSEAELYGKKHADFIDKNHAVGIVRNILSMACLGASGWQAIFAESTNVSVIAGSFVFIACLFQSDVSDELALKKACHYTQERLNELALQREQEVSEKLKNRQQ